MHSPMLVRLSDSLVQRAGAKNSVAWVGPFDSVVAGQEAALALCPPSRSQNLTHIAPRDLTAPVARLALTGAASVLSCSASFSQRASHKDLSPTASAAW